MKKTLAFNKISAIESIKGVLPLVFSNFNICNFKD